MLITLGIIGIVAAMTLPALIGKYKKKVTVTKLQKATTIINQALILSENDNGPADGWTDSSQIVNNETVKTYFEKYYKPYLKILRICSTYNECGFNTRTWSQLNGTASPYPIVEPSARIGIYLTDGIYMSILPIVAGGEFGYYFSTLQRVRIDVNGFKEPNTIGKDVFFFYIDLKKHMIFPEGHGLSQSDIINSCNKSGEGRYCGAKIIQDGWSIKEDYPW